MLVVSIPDLSAAKASHYTNNVQGTFVAAFCGMLTVVSAYYPDRPSVPRTFPDGLEAELGGPKALRARKAGDE